MIGHKVKFKRVDTGKYWTAGDVKEGKYGPQIGMKVTPELKAYLDTAVIGGWLNFSIDKPYDKAAKQEVKKETPDEFQDEIGF